MRQSQLFTKTTRHIPEGEEAKNAQLLIKAGFVSKSSAGVYSVLPLGLRVLNKITHIIREEMNEIGGEELLMPALIQRKYWEQTKRWDVDVIYRTGIGAGADPKQSEYGLGWTHEEVITAIATNFINSYKDLPKAVYQIQTKFRAEARAQAGLLRGREFLMKDLYSFHTDANELNAFYQKVIGAYEKIFTRMGLKTFLTEASGGAFTKEYTHEFQVLSEAGEDVIFYCPKCKFSQNREIYNEAAHRDCIGEIKTGQAIEVGNVFKLGIKFSEAFKLNYLDAQGTRHPVVMGSYGIGPTRVLGTIVEEYNDEKGMCWPESVAPFRVHLISLGDSARVQKAAESAYKLIRQKTGFQVLFDDRNVSAGEKLNDADLIGIPWRLVISEKTIAAKKIEAKGRTEKTAHLEDLRKFLTQLSKKERV